MNHDSHTPTDAATPTAPPPTGFTDYVKSLGPGIVVVVSWLGTGDFISASVAGSNFGYALIWTLLIAILSRYFIVSTMSRYQLCNSVGDETILDGYGRVWRGFPTYIGATTCVLGFVYVSFLLIAAGTALDHLFAAVVPAGQWGTFCWAIPTAAAALWLASRRDGHYRALEIVAQLTMAVLVLSFFVALVGTGVDFGELFGGLLFELPPGEAGYITAASTAVGLIGAVGGSAANLLYPYLMHEKGWRGQSYRKLQRIDLRFGTLVMFGLVLAVWVVAAETLHGTEQGVSSADGLALMMEKAIGPAGPPIMWCAVFFTVFNNIVTQPRVFVRMFVESLHKSRPDRAEHIRLRHRMPANAHKELFLHDRVFWIVFLLIMTVPLVFSLPFMPGMVVLTLLGNSVNVLTVPAVIIGLIVMTTRRDLMPASHVNKWWQTTTLALIGAIGLWATYQLILSVVNLLG
ncbi:Nramp family divalent metal transporter [Actinopolyspora sp. H202]|uniref:Nramp family divalent metal transporter n=1 Tax=Actinopolyspora sp. H202 TaxID=1500456 RepID=UPI003EE4E079